MIYLAILDQAGTLRYVPVDRPLTIGRDGADVDLDDTTVSRRQAFVRPFGEGLVVYDANSTYGTQINGAPAVGEVLARPGDALTLGCTTVRILDAPHAQPGSAPPVRLVPAATSEQQIVGYLPPPPPPASAELLDPRGKRYGAAVVDVGAALLIAASVGTVLGGNNPHPRANTTPGIVAFWLVVAIAWISIFVAMRGTTGKTPAGHVFGVKCVNSRGEPPGVGAAAVRSLVGLVDWIGFACVPIVGMVSIALTKRHQRIGDLAAKTYVVDDRWVGKIP